MYVSGGASNSLAVFSRDPGTGELTSVEVLKEGLSGVTGLVDATRTLAWSPRLAWASCIVGGLIFGYGMILADNGSAWYMSGVPDARWNNDDLAQLKTRVHGYDFEAVDVSVLLIDPDSGQTIKGR